MNLYFLTAGILCLVLGLIHSILGEFMIFNRKRKKGGIAPSKKCPDLKERHLRIIWATWHLASVLGWCIGAILITIATTPSDLNPKIEEVIVQLTICAMIVGFLLVLIGTKGKRPGWFVLLLIGILLLIGN